MWNLALRSTSLSVLVALILPSAFRFQKSSGQSKISDFFREMEDDIDTNALSDLMDQIDALEELDGVPEKKMKRS